ncbi:uncharacterized protein Smp_201970 [Schistosoma mansoni]|uniref:uncharacterized protein n=1 Tax=Schistosoma mansoni TaxID=6183 RepID=UPI00022DC6D8|nr:uncharacterized protein Smp_201970 [Schistosoma mansoni]|eukprot:XP_018650708.1 uncharacterized protein Smp_201970 [Schistosoma mansoni]
MSPDKPKPINMFTKSISGVTHSNRSYKVFIFVNKMAYNGNTFQNNLLSHFIYPLNEHKLLNTLHIDG